MPNHLINLLKTKEFKEKNPKNLMKIIDLFKEKPLILKIIIIIYYFASLIYLTVAIVAFLFKETLLKIPDFQVITLPLNQAAIIIGLLFLILSVASFLISTGLLKKKNWARMVLIILCTFNVLGGAFSIIKGNFLSTINLAFNLAIALYLMLNKRIKNIFTR